jgi:PAS domain-containing protein
MRLPLEPVARLRRALFPSQDSQFGWRLASVTVSLVSVGLIALTVAYRLRGTELPTALWVGLLASFATVVVLFSKFLFRAQQEGGQFQGAFTTTERKFQSVVENALDAILILDDQAMCREANPAAETLFDPRGRNWSAIRSVISTRIPTNSGKAGNRFSTTNSSKAMPSS